MSLPEGSRERSGLSAVQLGSVGALVALGVLGGASSAQATVKRGAQCAAVDQLQAALGDRGYDVGAVDGKFGGRTEAAVRRFQQQQNLLVDGIVGPATARAMGLPPEFSCSFATAAAVTEPVDLPQQGEFAVATNGGALRLRKAPAGIVVGALKNGDSVTVIETADGWAKLNSGAWVSRAWLQFGQKSKSIASNPQPSAQSPAPAESSPVVSAKPNPVVSVKPAPVAAPVAEQAAEPVAETVSPKSERRIIPPQTTLAVGQPGQVIQLLPSEMENSGNNVDIAAAPLKTGKIAVSLPPERSAAAETPSTVVDEAATANDTTNGTTVINAVQVTEVASVRSEPAAAKPDTAKLSTERGSFSPRFYLDSNQEQARTLLVAAASDSIVLPSPIAPESTPLDRAPVVLDPATQLSVEPAAEVAEPAEPLGSEASQSAEAPLAVAEPDVVAVRSSSRSMEVATYGDRLLIRDRPGGEVIGSIPNGLQISTISEQDGWYELETGGWVMARWLRG